MKNMIFNDFEALKKRKILESEHKIHVLIEERECLWVSYFAVDFVHTNKEMNQLLMESRKLDAQILKLSN